MKTTVLAIALSLVSLPSFASSSKPERNQIMLISQTEFQKMVEADFAQYVDDMKRQNFYLIADDRAQSIFDKIKVQIIKDYPQSKDWNWLFCGDSRMNFKAIGGIYGKVILGNHLFEKGLFNDDELAFVIAHEMIHSIHDHAREKYKKNQNSKSFLELSHIHEYEADDHALVLMEQAGFNAKNGIGYLKKMKGFFDVFNIKQGGKDSTHPSIEDRYNRLSTITNHKNS